MRASPFHQPPKKSGGDSAQGNRRRILFPALSKEKICLNGNVLRPDQIVGKTVGYYNSWRS
jgi:hypothetical protein